MDYCTIEDIETQTSTHKLTDEGTYLNVEYGKKKSIVLLLLKLSFTLLRSSMGIFVVDTLCP